MGDKPIPFTAPMVRAILDGRKSQTRRPMRPKRGTTLADYTVDAGPAFSGAGQPLDLGRRMELPVEKLQTNCAAGDRLWVREAWRTWEGSDEMSPTALRKMWEQYPPRGPGDQPVVRFEADGAFLHGAPLSPFAAGRLRAGMHLLREFARLHLIVEQVRVERVQDISEADAIAEGISRMGGPDTPYRVETKRGTVESWDPVCAYAALWDDIHGPQAWAANPWVAAITFRREGLR